MAGFRNGLQKVGDTYHYCFRIHGQQYKGSTRARDQKTAKKVLESKRQEALLGAPLIQAEPPTVSALVKDWLLTHAHITCERHRKGVEIMTRIWLIPVVGDLPIDKVTQGMILSARSRLLEAGRSLSTANHFLRIVKLLWNHAVEMGYIHAVPFKVKLLRVQKKPRPTVPASKVPEFLAAIDTQSQSPQAAVMLKVMLGMGLRESEVLGMRWEWFDMDNRTYTVGKAKGKEARVIPVPIWLWSALLTMPKTLSGWVFPGTEGRLHHPHYCKRVLRRVATELGLGNLTQHRLRATFASLHAEAGTPITEIQGMLGHKAVTTTMLYIEQSLDAKRRAQDALSLKLGLA
jgi:integrase